MLVDLLIGSHHGASQVEPVVEQGLRHATGVLQHERAELEHPGLDLVELSGKAMPGVVMVGGHGLVPLSRIGR